MAHHTGVERDGVWRYLFLERRRWVAVCVTCGWSHGPHRERETAEGYAGLHRSWGTRHATPKG